MLPDPDPGDLRDGQVLLRFLAAGICGSDPPGFRGVQGRLPSDTGALAAEMAGFPATRSSVRWSPPLIPATAPGTAWSAGPPASTA